MWFCSGRIDSERESRPEEAGLHAGTLDNTSWRAPVAYIWTRSAQPWVQFSDDALAFDTAPEGRGIPSQPLRERTWDLLDEMPSLTCTIEPLLQILEQLTTERKTLDKRLEQTARSDAVRQRLMSIPGVGPITGHAFRVTLDDPSRFDPSKAVGSHLGLTPKVYQPGETDRSGQISKSSDHLSRHQPYEAATALMTRCRQPSRLGRGVSTMRDGVVPNALASPSFANSG